MSAIGARGVDFRAGYYPNCYYKLDQFWLGKANDVSAHVAWLWSTRLPQSPSRRRLPATKSF